MVPARARVRPAQRSHRPVLATRPRPRLHALPRLHVAGASLPTTSCPAFPPYLLQLLRQAPFHFEFTDVLLELLLEHSQASGFGELLASWLLSTLASIPATASLIAGTLFFNSHQEREAMRVGASCPSLWSHLLTRPVRASFVNPTYYPIPDWFRPSYRPQFLAPWTAVYGRWTPRRAAVTEVRAGMRMLAAQRDTLRVQDALGAVAVTTSKPSSQAADAPDTNPAVPSPALVEPLSPAVSSPAIPSPPAVETPSPALSSPVVLESQSPAPIATGNGQAFIDPLTAALTASSKPTA